MKIVKTKHQLVGILDTYRQNKKIIGFVPTMGALHEGHLSLIHYSKEACDITVCSIFVNPTQFNNKSDLEKYPRMPEKDAAMLEAAGCDVLFMPDVEEVYPEKDTRVFDFGMLDKVLEGAKRPGHFNGVGQVVSKLFEMVVPDKAFFGLKDYQQLLIIKELTKQLKLAIEIVPCPILREKDGLAMSSRNMRLSASERKAAALIPQVMQKAAEMKKEGCQLSEIQYFVASKLSGPPYQLEYFSVCDPETLKELTVLDPKKPSIALLACFVGDVRLIDNLMPF